MSSKRPIPAIDLSVLYRKRVDRPRKRKPVIIPSSSRELICLDTQAIRKSLWAQYQRAQKSFSKIETEIKQFNEQDEAGYRAFMRNTFGAEMTQQHEAEEKIRLLLTRLRLMELLARDSNMKMGEYCYSIRDKVTEEKDLWTVLQEEYEAMMERLQKEEEEFQRRREERRAKREQKKATHEATGNEDVDDFDIEDLFDDLFQQFYSGDEDSDRDDECIDIPLSSSKQSSHSIKHLYRELCMKYHPDRIGEHDAATQALWNKIQTAYEKKDLHTLLSLHSGDVCVVGSDTVRCSDILHMIKSIKESTRVKRRDLRSLKRKPYYGFASWTAIKFKKVTREAREEFEILLDNLAFEISDLERRIETILKWKPKRTQKTRRKA